ncbi:MAG: nickel insertion protein, partial [Blastocatellia bacterium]
MTRTLYLDCFSGISGDMFIGAMIGAGLDFELLKSEIAKLGLSGFTLRVGTVDRSGISATKFDVDIKRHDHAHDHHHGHGHDHDHHHEHDHHHDHHHDHGQDHHHHDKNPVH